MDAIKIMDNNRSVSNLEERNELGQFRNGHSVATGRPPGSKNYHTKAKLILSEGVARGLYIDEVIRALRESITSGDGRERIMALKVANEILGASYMQDQARADLERDVTMSIKRVTAKRTLTDPNVGSTPDK